MNNCRKASEVMSEYSKEPSFPYDSSMVCYFGVDKSGGVHWINHTKGQRREAVSKVVSGEWKLYAAWPGDWHTDLFEIDDISKYVKLYS